MINGGLLDLPCITTQANIIAPKTAGLLDFFKGHSTGALSQSFKKSPPIYKGEPGLPTYNAKGSLFEQLKDLLGITKTTEGSKLVTPGQETLHGAALGGGLGGLAGLGASQVFPNAFEGDSEDTSEITRALKAVAGGAALGSGLGAGGAKLFSSSRATRSFNDIAELGAKLVKDVSDAVKAKENLLMQFRNLRQGTEYRYNRGAAFTEAEQAAVDAADVNILKQQVRLKAILPGVLERSSMQAENKIWGYPPSSLESKDLSGKTGLNSFFENIQKSEYVPPEVIGKDLMEALQQPSAAGEVIRRAPPSDPINKLLEALFGTNARVRSPALTRLEDLQ